MQVPGPALSPVKITGSDVAVRTDAAADARENPPSRPLRSLQTEKLPLLPLLSSRVDPSECEVEVPTSGHCRLFNQLPFPPVVFLC